VNVRHRSNPVKGSAPYTRSMLAARPDPADSRALRLLHPLRDFLRTEAAGGIVLVVATVAALVWANAAFFFY